MVKVHAFQKIKSMTNSSKNKICINIKKEMIKMQRMIYNCSTNTYIPHFQAQ